MLGREELVTALGAVLGKLSTSLCGQSGASVIVLEQMRQAADIGIDGTQDPAQTCDGISIGLGLSTKAATLGDPVPAAPIAPACGSPL